MSILIIGGAGFVGRNLIQELETQGQSNINVVDVFLNSDANRFKTEFPKVGLYRFNAAEGKSLASVIKNTHPHTIYHLAANSDIKLSSENPDYDIQNTFLTTANLLQSIPTDLKPAIFFASSSAVYGPKSGPISESEVSNPISSYGWMKYASESLLLKAKSEDVISKLVIFRFPNVVGKHMTHGVIFDLINKLKETPSRLKVLGDGTQEKPYVLASRLVHVIVAAMSSSEIEFETYNISAKDRCKVSKIVEIIVKASALTPEIEYGRSRNGWIGDVPEYELQTNKLRETGLANEFESSEEAVEIAVKQFWQEVSS
jgi:UDP-glucose 4-epimerase